MINITTQRVASPRTTYLSMMPIVTFTCDLQKQLISSSHHGEHVCQVRWRSTQRISLYTVHKLISIYIYCDLDLWSVTSKINRVYSLTMINMSAKFDEEAHNGIASIVFTSLFPYMSNVNFDLWPLKSIRSILSLWLTCLQNLMKYPKVYSLQC